MMGSNLTFLVILLSISNGICMKINCTDNQILALSAGIDTASVANIDTYKCSKIDEKEDMDSIACICGWYENCKSYFDEEMPENETIFVAGVDQKDAKTFYKCCWSSVFTYRVEDCKVLAKSDQIPFMQNDTHATVIASIHEHRFEVLTCTAQLRDDVFCYPPTWYSSTAGTDQSWIAGLVLGVVLPLAICQDADSCVSDDDCCLSAYCATTTGRCGRRPDGDYCATDDECVSGLCGAMQAFWTGSATVGYCGFPWNVACTSSDTCGPGYCGRGLNGGSFTCSCWIVFIQSGFEGWKCCNGVPETAIGTRCDLVVAGDPCTVDLDCVLRSTPRYCRNGVCSDT